MSEEAPWLPLEKAARRCERAGLWRDAFSDILKSGRVSLRGKRSGHVRADPIEDLLRRANRAASYPSGVSILSALNEITLYLDPLSSPEHRTIAIELDDFGGRIPGMLESHVTFKDVVVHWPKLVEEMQAAGFKITTRRQKPAMAHSVVASTGDKDLPWAKVSDDKVREWYEARVRQCETTGEKPSEAKDQSAARSEFGDKVRRYQVRNVRQELAPREWRIQGRRPKAADKQADGNSAE